MSTFIFSGDPTNNYSDASLWFVDGLKLTFLTLMVELLKSRREWIQYAEGRKRFTQSCC